jgi:uncharacterized membrane protein AbrB (regulator of aidB expression)
MRVFLQVDCSLQWYLLAALALDTPLHQTSDQTLLYSRSLKALGRVAVGADVGVSVAHSAFT